MRKKVSSLVDYEECNQQQLLNHLDTLSEEEREKLIQKLESINIRNLYDVYTHYKEKVTSNRELNPIQNVLRVAQTNQEILNQYQNLGEKLISEGKVCVAMMAGGQGTRLGFNKAKGMYDINLPSHKSLFQIFSERLLSLQNMIHHKLGQCLPIQFFIMTSDVNHEETTQYFIQHNYFGLQSDQITFFQQDSLPILSIDGQVLLTSQTTLLEGPDGNGGIYSSLYNQGYLDYMKCLGIKYIHICPVDNILCKLADPIWIGYVESQNLIICSKFVRKTNPEEKVGIHALINNQPSVIEYSEMAKEDLYKTNEKGELLYDAGGIAQVICTVDFVHNIIEDPQISSQLAANYHVAQKKYDYYDVNTNQIIKPQQINALKFELFFFDCYPLCQKEQFGLIEVQREDEFAPVKNASGEKTDTPETALQLYLNRDRKWLKQYGFSFNQETEISAKITYFGEGLENILPKYLGSKQSPLIIDDQKQQPQQQQQQQPQQQQQKQQHQQQQQQQKPKSPLKIQQPASIQQSFQPFNKQNIQKQPIQKQQNVIQQQIYPQVVYQSMVNSVQPNIIHVQPNYFPYQSTPQNNKHILVQENPVHSSQVFQQQQRISYPQHQSQQQLKQIKIQAFPQQNIQHTNKPISTNNMLNSIPQKQSMCQPIQMNTSLSPQRVTSYFNKRAATVQRPTMFQTPRQIIVQTHPYVPITSIKK